MHKNRGLSVLDRPKKWMLPASDVALFCMVFHTTKRGFLLSVAVESQVLPMTGGEAL